MNEYAMVKVSSHVSISFYVGLVMRKRVLCHMRTTKGADQLAHPRTLISTFVVPALIDSMICILTISKVSRF